MNRTMNQLTRWAGLWGLISSPLMAIPLQVTPGPAGTEDLTARLTPDSAYSAARGYGLTGAASIEASPIDGRMVLTSAEPFFFHVDLPEGTYRVHAVLGGDAEASDTTVRAESRRLMVRDVVAGPGQTAEVDFLVNIRTPALPDGGRVSLKPRETGVLHWDHRLTLEFGGTRPVLAGLTITPETEAITVYLAGDSTVTDQPTEPWCGWGQMLPVYFGSGVAVANHAESGLSIRSFVAQRRLDKILSTLRPGDYVWVQFAHNDQKERGEGIGPFASYAEALANLAQQVRAGGGHPVFITSMYRRRFSGTEMFDTLDDYPVAMRQVAARENVPLIDLHAGSRVMFEALGPEDSKRAFVHFPAHTFPNQESALRDDTHFTTYGGDLLARYVVEELRRKVPELARHISDGWPDFDPTSPPPPDDWTLRPSAALSLELPDGR
jgi:lysophospholipase L1-like esterase